jgi:hypothetical protein
MFGRPYRFQMRDEGGGILHDIYAIGWANDAYMGSGKKGVLFVCVLSEDHANRNSDVYECSHVAPLIG